MKNNIEVGDIFRRYGDLYLEAHGGAMPLRQHKTMSAIRACRTGNLGGHVDECNHCGELRISYNSCRNRHCPKCQSLDKERWLEARKKEVLPVSYFHVVFTIPDSLRSLALRNQKIIYDILFKSVAETIKELTRDTKHLGAETGFIAILHTWTQALIDHPHIHCIVPGGGLSLGGKAWISCKKDYFITVQVISRLFKGKFLFYLKEAFKADELYLGGSLTDLKKHKGFKNLLDRLYNKEWVIYCKPPFRNADTVIEYLGRYTHRVAISNDRIISLKHGKVSIRYRDSGDGDKTKYMSLDAFEFIRRFLLHVLPDQFMKIRYYGILSNRNRKEKLLKCRKILDCVPKTDEVEKKECWENLLLRLTGVDPRVCPKCKQGRMRAREMLCKEKSCRSPPDT